jgi:formate hydrogenlyase subunit 6/NADH:ubiquinone oxidoreductase subunit I
MGEPADELIATRLWGHVLIDEDACTSCQMCATFCPTGALAKFSDDDGTFGIEHAPSECVKCRCCEDICPAGALTLSDEVHAADLLEGAVDRHVMRPVERTKGTPHSIQSSMKKLLGIDQVYE